MLLEKLSSQKYFSVPYGEILGPCIILHSVSVLAFWPVPGGAAPVLSRSFEYQQRRSSSWGLKEGIDHVWWIGACVVEEEWLVNGWKMWELVLSSWVAACSSSLTRGPSCPSSVGDAKESKSRAAGREPAGVGNVLLGMQSGSSWVALPQLTIGFLAEGRLNETPLWSMAVKPRGPVAADDTGWPLDEIKSSSSFLPVPWSIDNSFDCNAAPAAPAKPATTTVWAGQWTSLQQCPSRPDR